MLYEQLRPVGSPPLFGAQPPLATATSSDWSCEYSVLTAAEAIAGPYVWTIYDLLLLPPSFPYGGMVRRKCRRLSALSIAADRRDALVISWGRRLRPFSQENPCCTYVTPTLLAGDRSLDRVVCHEIAHRSAKHSTLAKDAAKPA